MPAEVESLFYTKREKPWHGLGIPVAEALTSADAIKMAGLDWNVIQKPIYADGNIEIPGHFANLRDIDNKPLGIVTNRYQIVQNKDAFDFTDSLVGGDVKYETAGSLFGGKKIWLLAKLPETDICGDAVENYVCFTNSHDGLASIRACVTPVRVVCNNTLNLALNTAKRSWSTKHIGDLQSKLVEAKHTLEMAQDYTEALRVEADKLANTTVTHDQIMEALNDLFPVTDDSSDTRKRNVAEIKNDFMCCYYMPDIKKFEKTAWGVVNAAADFVAHSAPKKNTDTYYENNFDRIVNGHPLLDAITQKMQALMVRA